MNDSFVKQLKGNAIFQMSLSSKELFHSNFLAWLAEDENTHCVFNLIMRSWTDNANWSLDTEKVTIKREYNHFDFCVCDNETGGVQLVLENKFKSIAYKAQLENYKEKTATLNEEGFKIKYKQNNKDKSLPKNWRNTVVHPTTKYVLLTLAEEFVDREAIQNLGWKIVSYADYVKILREGAKLIKTTFYRKLIELYCDFIELFAQHTNTCLQKIKGEDEWSILYNEDYQNVRCNDIWQKVVMHKLAQKLTELTIDKFPDTPIIYDDKDSWDKSANPPLMIRVAYYHGQALLELKRLLQNGVVFCVQQQGDNHLSIGMVVDKKETIDKKLRKKKSKIEWYANIKKLVVSKKLASIISGNEFYSFQTEGACGFYYIQNSQKLNIKNTLNLMVELMDKAIKATKSK